MAVAYPTPHRLRRNFTLYPYADLSFPPLWGDDSSAPPLPVDLMINTTMTKENVGYLVNNYEGDFFGFQTYFENPVTVNLAHYSWFSVWGSDTQPHRDLMWVLTSSSAGELTLAVCTTLCLSLIDFSSDMGGTCPDGAGPPDCYAGPKWPPNDPLFFLHHAVRGPSTPFSHLAHVYCIDG